MNIFRPTAWDMCREQLSEREHQILEAVVRLYVETAEPVGSRTIARRFNLGISPATVRNTMSDLEAMDLLYHPHTSAGRIPTDQGYRLFVDSIMPTRAVRARASAQEIRRRFDESSTVEDLVGRAAQVLGLLTRELGIAVAPRLDDAVLERLELVPLTDSKVLVVLALRSGAARAIYMDLPLAAAPGSLQGVARVLNERLSGSTIAEIRATLPDRLRDSVPADDRSAADVIEVFVRSADLWLEAPAGGPRELRLGRTSVLADQPEFASGERLRGLLELIEHEELLGTVLGNRMSADGLEITIGMEHDHPELADFTVVTSKYRVGGQEGVIGVIGPTRMAYEQVIDLVAGTSQIVSELGSLDHRN